MIPGCPCCDGKSPWCDMCNGVIDSDPPALVCWGCRRMFEMSSDVDRGEEAVCPHCGDPWPYEGFGEKESNRLVDEQEEELG